MTENYYTNLTVEVLKHKGFKAFKHCDKVTVGVPDISASRDHVTWWIEAKLQEVDEFTAFVNWKKILTKKHEPVQLANMVSLERAARAIYLLFQVKNKQHHVYVESPARVAWSIKENTGIAATHLAEGLEDLFGDRKLEDLPTIVVH